MPIIVQDVLAAATAQSKKKTVATSRFFSHKLTGNGQKRGLLTMARNPANVHDKDPVTNDMLNMAKRSFDNGQRTVTMVPFYTVPYSAWGDSVTQWPAEARSNLCEFAHIDQTGVTTRIYVNIRPYSLRLLEDPPRSGRLGKKIVEVCYQVNIWAFDDNATDESARVVCAKRQLAAYDSANPVRLMVGHAMNPRDCIESFAQ